MNNPGKYSPYWDFMMMYGYDLVYLCWHGRLDSGVIFIATKKECRSELRVV